MGCLSATISPATETIGTGHDFWTAYREGAFGAQPKPFVGWMMLVEGAPGSRSQVKDAAPHFPVFPASRRNAASTGDFQDLSRLTGLKSFVAGLAVHIATVAARER